MNIEKIKEKIFPANEDQTSILTKLGEGFSVNAYANSVNTYKNLLFFIGKRTSEKYLYILYSDDDSSGINNFKGEILNVNMTDGNFHIKQCALIHENVIALQNLFDFTKPVVVGLRNSFGFGDRLGLANPGHVRSLIGYSFKPIFAQQSIRELTRTHRTADEVMDAAVWAVFQEGYKDGFGADADHLKTTQDIDMLMKANYKMFTLDPSDHIFQNVDSLTKSEINDKFKNLPWKELYDTAEDLMSRYDKKEIKVGKNLVIVPTSHAILKASLKYLKAFAYIKKLSDYFKTKYSRYDYEIEVSIDETDTVTTPFEHYFIVNELKRLKVDFISLAPRFVGDFEKGIDYKGDIELFKSDYIKHIQILEHFGFYKMSFHSGSDKFAVYNAVAQINRGVIHIKTAGTSYLEALKVVAEKDPQLFREVLDFSKSLFDTEKATYHVSAKVENVKDGNLYGDDKLLGLMSIDDPRQILHVAFGRVLTEKNNDGTYLFRDRLLECLKQNEELYYDFLIKHFHKHLDPFNGKD
jgi:hypothetical protein